MRNDHIMNLLEEDRLAALSADKVSIIESHVGDCPDCFKAYRAASVSAAMLKARVAETIEPSPFFKTRVMAALDERGKQLEPSPLRRLWMAAGKLVSAMALIVAVLTSLTMFGAESQPTAAFRAPFEAAQFFFLPGGEAVESVLFEDDAALASDEMTDAQALETIFEAEDADGTR